jgi:hypothetical protein
MSHQIEIEELQSYMLEEKVLYARGSKENKSLYITLRGSFEVWHNKERVLETMQAITAIEKYNSI